MMKVNDQVCSEITDVLQSQRTLVYQITCWDAHFDQLADWSFRARQQHPTFDGIQHLVVEIHPPHQDRLIDMLYIWRRAQKLCDDLRAIKQVPQLSVHFEEDDIAAWSTKGIPHQSMGIVPWWKHPKNNDIGQLIHLFAHLTNVTKARISLPSSLRSHDMLTRWAKYTEGSMMGRWVMNQEELMEEHELFEEDITDSGWGLRNATGRKSKLKLEQFYGKNPLLTIGQYLAFVEKWPHMDDLPERERPHVDHFGDWDYYDYRFCDY